ncbi:related to DUF726 domain protein [Cephalotrichum gorgonifer]|uniref:Related to DUF726 domain protein n=1 Tax=Cephalotrichum gorgonifer TaxID=2041049 RepID=A0AAE8SYE4_9PEZI|nr:related to DUF726 domain protein [Cephalotrichum gorgonifer]
MGRGHAQGPSRRGVDLTGVITFAEKEDLIILVSRITEKMIRQIGDVFDSPPPVPSGAESPNTWVTISVATESQRVADGTQGQPQSIETTEDQATKVSGHSSTYTPSLAHSMSEADENVPPPQLGELKKELFVIFKKWQSTVLQRVRDIRVAEAAPPGHIHDSGFFGGGRGPLRPQPFNETDPQLIHRFRPSPTPLWQLPLANRKRLMHVTLLLLLSLEEYTAYSRNLMFHLTSSLHLPLSAYQEIEIQLGRGLGQCAVEFDPVEALRFSEELKAARKGRSGPAMPPPPKLAGTLSRGLVAAGVGALIGVGTSGKVIAAGLLGPMSEIGVPVGGLFGIYMAKSSIKPMDAYTRDIQDFAFVPLHGKVQTALRESSEVHHEDRRLRLVVAISGWLLEEEDVMNPWKCFGSQGEVHAFRWEMNTLKNLGTALDTVIQSGAWGIAKKAVASQKIFATLGRGSWPAELLKISKIIDIPWSVGMVRADKAGLILADTIQRKVHGSRPVTLIGYSLASRVIYTCLMALAERRQFGLIDSVVMIGTPAPSEARVWLTLRSVVAGRLVNVYSENDYMLGFMMRISNTQFGVAGLQPITGALGVENYNASDMVSGHLRYQFLIGRILKSLGWEDLDHNQVAQDQITLAGMDVKYGKAKHMTDTAAAAKEEDTRNGKRGRADGRGGGGPRGRGGGFPRRARRNNYRGGGQSRPGKNTIQT